MKRLKTLLILCAIPFIGLSAFSAETAQNYKTAPAFVRVTTNMLGYNLLTKKIASSVLKKSLKKSISGDYKVKFDSFSGVDLKKGKFKGLTIEGKDLSVENELYISKLNLKTTSDFNYVDYKKKPMVFKTDLPLAYSVEMTESDLNKTLTMGPMFDTICTMIPLIKIEKPKLKLVGEKVKMTSSVKVPFAKPIKFSMTSGLKVESGKIILSDVKSSGSKELSERLVDLINKQNVLENIDINVLDDTDCKTSIDNIKIKDDKVFIDGKIIFNKTK